MVLIGNVITPFDVVADQRYSHLKADQVTTKLLSSFTMEKMVLNDQEASERINTVKKEYGTGVSSLIRIYNASGHTLKFRERGPNWSGHVWKYPYDEIILNGQWSVVLHVKSSGAARGSVSCFVYTVEDEGGDVFCGWSNPFDRNRFSNTVYTEIKGTGHWPDVVTWDSMYYRVEGGSENGRNTWLNGSTATIVCTANTGNVASPQINFVVSATEKQLVAGNMSLAE